MATNREQQAQLLMGAYGRFAQDHTVEERREIQARTYQALGVKGIDRLVTKAGTQTLAAIEKAMQSRVIQPPPPATAPLAVSDPSMLRAMGSESAPPGDEATLEAQAAAAAAADIG